MMPQMGVSVAEGTVVAWRAAVGDQIEAEQTICEISTDKIDTEVPAPVSGVVAEILVDVDQTVSVGAVLARIAAGDGAAGPAHCGAGARPAAPEPTAPRREPPRRRRRRCGAGASLNDLSGRPPAGRYSPVVQRIAAEHGIDLDSVPGTGRGGRVRKQDVLALVDGNGAVAEAPLHIESPYRPEPAPRASTGEGLAHAPSDRRAHEALARDGRHVYDLDRGRHGRRRDGPAAARCDLAGVRRAGDDRGTARTPGVERVAGGRALHTHERGQPRDRSLARRRRADRARRSTTPTSCRWRGWRPGSRTWPAVRGHES